MVFFRSCKFLLILCLLLSVVERRDPALDYTIDVLLYLLYHITIHLSTHLSYYFDAFPSQLQASLHIFL